MASHSPLNKRSAVKALTSAFSSRDRDVSGNAARASARALARATRERPWAQPRPEVGKITARSVKPHKDVVGPSSPPPRPRLFPRPPISRPGDRQVPIAVRLGKLPAYADIIVVPKTRRPASTQSIADAVRDGIAKLDVVKQVGALSAPKTRSPVLGARDGALRSPVVKKGTPAKVTRSAAPVNTPAAKKTKPGVTRSPRKANKKEVAKPALVKSHAGIRATLPVENSEPAKPAPSPVNALIASGLMKRIKMESGPKGDFDLLRKFACVLQYTPREI